MPKIRSLRRNVNQQAALAQDRIQAAAVADNQSRSVWRHFLKWRASFHSFSATRATCGRAAGVRAAPQARREVARVETSGPEVQPMEPSCVGGVA